MKTKTLLTVLLFVLVGAISSVNAQRLEYVGFYQQFSGGNTEYSQNGNLVRNDNVWPYFSSPAVVEFAIEVTGNIYPMPDVYLQLNGSQRFNYTASEYGKTIYGTMTLQGYSYNYYNFTINPTTTTGSGNVNARIRIVRIVSGNAYARIGYPTELTVSLTK